MQLLRCTTNVGNVPVVVPDDHDDDRAVPAALRAPQRPAQGACERASAARVLRRGTQRK